MRPILIILLLLASAAAHAATTTIDFDVADITSPVEFYDGRYIPPSGHLVIGSYDFYNGGFLGVLPSGDGGALEICHSQSYGCVDGYGNSGFSFSHIADQAFSLHSFDAWAGTNCIDVRGKYADGTYITAYIGGPFGTEDCSASQGTVSFSAEWTNLVEVTISINDYSDLYLDGFSYFDNVVVSTVPVPAAVWLFGSALVALGWLRRK